MKRAVLLFTVFCVLAGGIAAQQIRASPFEGRWVWDGRGKGYPEFTELVFFGNVMLGMEDDYPVYEGMVFSYSNKTINFGEYHYGDYDEQWEYSLSGNTITITDEWTGSFTYTRSVMEKSPIEGIWKLTGGTDFDPDEDSYLLFTGNIMAFEDGDGYYEGFGIEFKGKAFHPSRILIEDDMGAEDIEKALPGMTMEYRLSGNTLTIISPAGDEELILTKFY